MDTKEEYGTIYKIQNKVNGKIYIGQTTRTFKKRYNSNVFKNTHNDHLRRSIMKYGKNSFDIIERFDVAYSKEELNRKEEYYISKYRCCDIRYGYNKKTGGDNEKMSDEAVLKQISAQGNPIYCLTTKEGYLSSCIADSKYNKKIGDGLTRYRKYQTIYNGKVLIFVNPLTYYKTKVGVVCLTNNKFYSSMQEAEKKLNIKRGSIQKLFSKKINCIKNDIGIIFTFKLASEFYRKDKTNNKLNEINKLYTGNVKIQCIETGIIYNTGNDVYKKLKIKTSRVHKSCIDSISVRANTKSDFFTFKYI